MGFNHNQSFFYIFFPIVDIIDPVRDITIDNNQ